MNIAKRLGTLVLASSVGFASGLAPASVALAQEHPSAFKEFVLGTTSALSTLLWGTGKVIYAVGGSVTAGLAWCVTGGRSDIASQIIQPALRGDYVVTPKNLTGEEPISFVGRDPERDPYPY